MMTRDSPFMKTKVWIVLAVVAAVQILFDPLSSILYFSQGVKAKLFLSQARQKWETQNITHYKFDIKGGVPLVCFFGGNIEVKDGTVIRRGPSSDAGMPSNPFLDAGFVKMEDPVLCNYMNYTIPLLFDMVQQWTKGKPFYVTQISFDPKYGFISGFSFGNSGGNGLLSPGISDCCGGFSIRNFQVLDESIDINRGW